jgi:hypothetical protein
MKNDLNVAEHFAVSHHDRRALMITLADADA